MERWSGILNASSSHDTVCRVAASLCSSPSFTAGPAMPYKNAILFMGDRVEGTGNAVIDRLSDLEVVASVLVSKLGSTTNAWVVEAPAFVGPFAVYKDFLSSAKRTGEPISYNPQGFPAATSTTSILADCLQQVKAKISHECPSVVSGSTQSSNLDSWKKCPQSVVFGFSKGGVVLNQLLTEIAHSKDHVGNLRSESIGGELADFSDVREQQQKLNQEHLERKTEINLLVPTTPQEFLESIQEFHYVDVGLNCPGAYQTDQAVIEGIGKAAASRKKGLRILLHGTPRQWADRLRPWISSEKDTFLVFLREQARKHKENKLEACEKLYFADRTPSLQMHFEIIEYLDLS